MRLLMVIPAYNEEDNIVRVVNTIKERYKEYDYVVVMTVLPTTHRSGAIRTGSRLLICQ